MRFSIGQLKTLIFILSLNFITTNLVGQNGKIIPTDKSQINFLKSYKLILNESDYHYKSTGVDRDGVLFPEYGEYSIYWIASGLKKGSFVFPNKLPNDYSMVSAESYTNYNWKANSHLSINYQKEPRKIAIFKSKNSVEGNSLSWESLQFIRLFESYLGGNSFYVISEEDIVQKGIDPATEFLIFPAFAAKDDNHKFYIDSIFTSNPNLTMRINEYIQKGGNIYCEGNAVNIMEHLGLLAKGSINYSSSILSEDDVFKCKVTDPLHPAGFCAETVNNEVFGNSIPQVVSGNINKIIELEEDGRPVLFSIKNSQNQRGSILCNLGLPTVGGFAELNMGSRQLQWALNAMMYAFASQVDITRNINNDLAGLISAGKNSISYDRIDTFQVEIIIRNLSSEPISDLSIEENILPVFSFVDVEGGVSYGFNNHVLSFNEISVAPFSERKITYRLKTPEPESEIYREIEEYISNKQLVSVSQNTSMYSTNERKKQIQKNRNYAHVLFSARIFADTDVNWKNFLGLDYQPFKVFMIMENKERTPAKEIVYTQYIPKDVPFYWVDHGLNIPILKTPGGKFVDVLKGSNNEKNPDYDMDSDGHPDVWLDTASIFPKGYTIIEEEVYWANPWNHLSTGDPSIVFEDIDRDGKVAKDEDGDGIVDIEEPGDKIRVWKVTWELDQMEGYEYYDPYCSYEIWVDPPDLVPLAAGVGYVYDSLKVNYPGMFYPNSPDLDNADSNDMSWMHWMQRDDNGEIIWKQLIQQKINNYEGFAFIDTSSSDYFPLPTDSVLGTVPQPNREFIAVLSMGGEEIDMRNPTPKQSLYSKINYKTIFDEKRVTPIRTTYTYYAPLPNPLQFEYLSNSFTILDPLGNSMEMLPVMGDAKIIYDIDASTEYTYYWIRNVGYDVDYNDPSETIDNIEDLGDGVFGYFIYEIPKGLGGYNISLPQKADGSFDTDAIVKIDGKSFEKWIDNPNTSNQIEIWETPFTYQVYIPQVLIPPALDDDNFDGVDDWIDDRGDRFASKTGFLHDKFMPDDGEDWLDYPLEPFIDDIYGKVDSGWYNGADETYGDDFFETLGKTHIQIQANYTGNGREGLIEIGKGGILVVEEIFGGSPWVIFSHVLSSYAQGIDYKLTSSVNPSIVKFGVDTVCIKHVIEDKNEPHSFNVDFDPYHLSYGFKDATITTFVGAKDPCSLIDPVISMPAVLDPSFDNHSITLIPHADQNNPDLNSFPKQVTGTFLEVRVEVMNCTDNNWINTSVIPDLGSDLGSTSLEMNYVAYPRPLVPTHVSNGEIIPGDQPGTFTTGWRFNQPEGEVLVKMGNTMNLIQPTRRAYFVFLFNIDPNLENGLYEIPFYIQGNEVYYSGENNGDIDYKVPKALFSIVDKNSNGKVQQFEEIVLDQATNLKLKIMNTGAFQSLNEAKWSVTDVDVNDFENLQNSIPISSENANLEINLAEIGSFPTKDTTKIYVLHKGIVNSENALTDTLQITHSQELDFMYSGADSDINSKGLVVSPVGPRVRLKNTVKLVNGVSVTDSLNIKPDQDNFVNTLLKIANSGLDVSSNTEISINTGPYFELIQDSLSNRCTFKDNILTVKAGLLIPGESTNENLLFKIKSEIPKEVDLRTIIYSSNIDYNGTAVDASFSFNDPDNLLLNAYDVELNELLYFKKPNGEIEISAVAGNRGKKAEDIWLRIYPVFDSIVSSDPITEKLISELNTCEKVSITGSFHVPDAYKLTGILAKIDDNNILTEVFEKNNILTVERGLLTEDVENYLLYPNPFTDVLKIEYFLVNPPNKIVFELRDLNGKLVNQLMQFPQNKGYYKTSWRPGNLEKGAYIYRIIVWDENNHRVIRNEKVLIW